MKRHSFSAIVRFLTPNLLAVIALTSLGLGGCKKSVTREGVDAQSAPLSSTTEGGGGSAGIATGEPNGGGTGGTGGEGGPGLPPGTAAVTCVTTTLFANYWRTTNTETLAYFCVSNKTGNSIATRECQLNDAPWVPCSGANLHVLSGMTDGPKSFRVRATDNEGNAAMSPALNWGVDTAGPVFSAAGMISKTTQSARFTFQAGDAGSGFSKYQCKMSAVHTAWQDCVPPQTFDGLTAGTSYTFFVRAYDNAGNVSSVPSEVPFATDVTLPPGSCTILSSIPRVTNIKNQVISFSCQNAGGISAVECRVNNAAWGPCDNPSSHTVMGEGPQAFELRYRDTQNNAGPSTSVSWTVDTVIPTVTITSVDVSTLNSNFAFTGNGTGSDITSYKCRLMTGATVLADWTTCSSPRTYNVSAGKAYTFNVKSYDEGGNESVPARYDWTSNPGQGPGCVILTNFTSPWRKNVSETIAFSCSSPANIAKVEYSRNCSVTTPVFAQAATRTSQTIPRIVSGTTTSFCVRATDEYGNVGAPSAALQWMTDTDKPLAKINLVEISHPTSKLFFSSTDTGGSGVGHMDCKFDGLHDWIPCDSPKLYAGLVLNTDYTFRLRSFDSSGNESDPAAVTWRNIPAYFGPECRLTRILGFPGGISGWTNSRSAVFGIECTGPKGLKRIECSTNGQVWNTCTTPFTHTVTTSGDSHFFARGIDPSDVVGPVDHQTWLVDLTPPTVTVSAPTFEPGKVVLAFSSADAGGSGVSKTECQLDGVSAWADCVSPARYTGGVTPGASFTFRVRAMDSAGNSSGEVARSWTNGGWTNWTVCSKTCGPGTNTRACTAPAPAGGGLRCVGDASKACNLKPCPPPHNPRQVVDCSSWEYKYAECGVPACQNRLITGMNLLRKYSNAECIFEVSPNSQNQYGRGGARGGFGFFRDRRGGNRVWVNHGCRGQFQVVCQ